MKRSSKLNGDLSDLGEDSRVVTSRLEAAARAAAVADGVIAADPTTDGKKKPDELRRGKWSPEEESYANRVIVEFKRGTIPVNEGTTLRSLLAELLKCDPMRISKKFVGQNCIGKQVYRLKLDDITPEETARYRRELIELERKFDERVMQTSKSKSTSNAKGSRKDDRASGEEKKPGEQLAGGRSRSSSLSAKHKGPDASSLLLSAASSSSSSSYDPRVNGVSSIVDFSNKTGFDTDALVMHGDKDTTLINGLGLQLSGLPASSSSAQVYYSLNNPTNYVLPSLSPRDASVDAAADLTTSSSTSSAPALSAGNLPHVTSFDLFPVGEAGSSGNFPYSASLSDFPSFANLHAAGGVGWESNDNFGGLGANSSSDKERGHKSEDVGLTIDEISPHTSMESSDYYIDSREFVTRGPIDLTTENRPPLVPAHGFSLPGDKIVPMGPPPVFHRSPVDAGMVPHGYSQAFKGTGSLKSSEQKTGGSLPKNNSVDNFWLLVQTGIIPSPDEDVLRQTLWQTSKESNPALAARYANVNAPPQRPPTADPTSIDRTAESKEDPTTKDGFIAPIGTKRGVEDKEEEHLPKKAKTDHSP